MGLLLLVAASALAAGQPEVHYLHQGVMPPGAIGRLQLARGGPLPGFFQPVEIKAPQGASVSLAVDGRFEQPNPTPRRVGMLIGQVYRLRVTGIPMATGAEVFPTVEIIDRLYTPEGQANRFAIPIELSAEDLRLAAQGKFITRVIYLEDPLAALPIEQKSQQQNTYDAAPGQDPLAMADTLGRPVAIVRLGGRLPIDGANPDARFLFGCPPFETLEAGSAAPSPNAGQQRPQLIPVLGDSHTVRPLPGPPKATLPRRQPRLAPRVEVRR
ncbi:MAG: hypothetical protein JW818_14280 [Pirellulales bacterium]|nr:hypothetical protein [Pirellulales bacterium]